MVKYSYPTNERHNISNIRKVAHAVNFIAEIDVDKVPARLLPALLALSEKDLIEMCTGATLNAIETTNMLEIANENNSWAEVKLA
jgi:hypothetical protein